MCNSDCCISSCNKTNNSETCIPYLLLQKSRVYYSFILFFLRYAHSALMPNYTKLNSLKKNMEFLRRIFRHAFEKRLNVFRSSYGLTSLSNFCLHMGRVLFEKAVNKLSALRNTKVH